MSIVKIAERKIWVDDVAIPLVSGEVHYWRLDPHCWREAVRRVKEMGLQVVATYVCWDFHQVAHEQYDFSGETDPRRNLLGFLDLLAQEGLWVIIRPGPYIYSEWRNGGVPDDAAQYHRLHPAFQAQARSWLQAVTAALLPHLATRGGRIILWQADNEIDPWTHYYIEQLGLGNEVGPFQDFLRARYENVAALNRAWGAAYQSFEDARAVMAMRPDEPDQMRRYLDFARFQHWCVLGVAKWTVDTCRELGVDVPIYLNAYSGVAIQPWADLERMADLAGPDIYPSNEFAHRPNEHRNMLEAVRYTRTYSRLPYIPEFEAGIWHEWLADVGALTPGHYRLMCLSALLGGIAGWNWYMLVNRDNWYQSPINEWGRARPGLFEAFSQIVALHAEVDPTTLTKLAATAVTHDVTQRGTVRPGQDLLESLYRADIDYEFYNTGQGKCEQPLLLYAGGSWLAADAQARLAQYVENGGHLICAGAYPRLDDQLRPLNLLGMPDLPGIVSGSPDPLRLAVTLGSETFTVTSPWCFNYGQTPGEPIVAERLPVDNQAQPVHARLQAGARWAIGFTQPCGQGRLTMVGLAPSPELLVALHRHFGVPLYARSLTPGIATALFSRQNDLYLVAVNHGNEDKCAQVALSGLSDERRAVQDLVSGERWSLDSDRLVFPLQRKDGTILRMTSRE